MSQCVWYVSKYVVGHTEGEPPSRGFGIMREIARAGYEAVVITSDSTGVGAKKARRPYEIDTAEGVTLCRIRTMQYSAAKSSRRIASWLDFEWGLLRMPKGMLPEPDVIVASSLSLLTVLNGLRLRRKYHCRLVFEVRDIWPLTLTEEGGFSPRNPVVVALGAIEKTGYRRADAIVGTMPNLGEHVERVLGEPRPTYCVPMGVDMATVDRADSLDDDYVATYISSGKFLVAYSGSIGISNALDPFFHCVESMQDDESVHFVILGDGQLREGYERDYGHLPNLTFAPKVPKNLVHDFLSRCDLLYLSVHASSVWDYGLSLNKMIDYMLAAKPIVASYSGYPSMINEAGCGTFVPAGDSSALQEEIRRYARLPKAERDEIGARGRRWLLANRDYAVLARQYLQILFPPE